MNGRTNWTARMVFWPALAFMVIFVAQWKPQGMNFARMGAIAGAGAIVVLAVTTALWMILREPE